MLDRDLAELYGVETKRLKEQVNRNLDRFPAHFMFELTSEENTSLRSQNATLKPGTHSKYLPYAFTEHGILMLFREMLLSHKDLLLQVEKLEKQVVQNSADIKMIFAALKKLLVPPEQANRRRIGFRRQNELS